MTTPPKAGLTCSCGFTDKADETATDHVLLALGADAGTGTDGQVHEEVAGGACTCGQRFAASADLDTHFIEAFTPADGIAPDGHKHQLVNAA